jgi:hypothetical protein
MTDIYNLRKINVLFEAHDTIHCFRQFRFGKGSELIVSVFTPLNKSHNSSAIGPTALKTIFNHDVFTRTRISKVRLFLYPST